MAISPLGMQTDLITFSIMVNGTQISDTIEVVSIRTEQALNKISEAEITLLDGSASEETFKVSESDEFIPGSDIEIKLGYHSKEDTVFKGIIVKQRITIDSAGPLLHVICKDKAAALTVHRKNIVFSNQSDSDIMKKILGEYSVSQEVSTTQEVHETVVQHCVSDWNFLINRAAVNSMVTMTDNGKVIVTKPGVSVAPVLKLTYGNNIMDFDCVLDSEYQYKSVETSSWDSTTQSEIYANSTEPTVNAQGNLSGLILSEVLGGKTHELSASAINSKESLKSWADAILLSSRLSRFSGTVTFQGSSLAKTNTTVELSGLGNRFNGNAFVSGVSHLVKDGDWRTRMTLGYTPEHRIESLNLTSSATVSESSGLHIGIVKQVHDDPKSEFRVLVEIPKLDDNYDQIWARFSNLYAGNESGIHFLPEIGDEVVVGFTNNDTRFPVILGSMHSSTNPAPVIPDRDNSIKAIITKSKLQLRFNEEDKTITIETPGGNSMVLSDEEGGLSINDTNGNKIELNSGGITINSASKLTLQAEESIEIKSQNLNIQSDMATRITGTAECEISSSGQTSVKGAMVMIN